MYNFIFIKVYTDQSEEIVHEFTSKRKNKKSVKEKWDEIYSKFKCKKVKLLCYIEDEETEEFGIYIDEDGKFA